VRVWLMICVTLPTSGERGDDVRFRLPMRRGMFRSCLSSSGLEAETDTETEMGECHHERGWNLGFELLCVAIRLSSWWYGIHS
jgi:hypothetical protein